MMCLVSKWWVQFFTAESKQYSHAHQKVSCSVLPEERLFEIKIFLINVPISGTFLLPSQPFSSPPCSWTWGPHHWVWHAPHQLRASRLAAFTRWQAKLLQSHRSLKLPAPSLEEHKRSLHAQLPGQKESREVFLLISAVWKFSSCMRSALAG